MKFKNMERKSIKNLFYNKYNLIIGAFSLISFASINEVSASTPINKESSPEQNIAKAALITGTASKNMKIEKPKPLLTAEHAPLNREIAIIDSLALEDEFEDEDLLFPADELYQVWDNHTVNPYSSLNMPEKFSIDLSSTVMPLDHENIKVNSKFGPRGRRMHKGIDLDLEVGDTVRAVCDGKVRVKRLEGLKKGYGYFIILRHTNGLETVYGHLSQFLVEEDQIVRAGDPIALGGNTGRSTGPHLHFETRFFGIAINPADMFDFSNKVAHQDAYVFEKGKVSENKYTTKGKGKIVYHRIKSGETLGSIARKYGMSINQLCKLNNISSKTKIRAGKTLRCS